MNQTVIALGFFDGVHRGHGALLEKTVQRARELGAEPVVFTFDRPPKEVVTGKPVLLINSPEDRRGLVKRLYGIERIILAPFDREMMTLPWDAFVEQKLVRDMHAVHLVAGHDHRFGHKNQGTPQLLQEKCRELGLGSRGLGDVYKRQILSPRWRWMASPSAPPTSANWWRAAMWRRRRGFWDTATA